MNAEFPFAWQLRLSKRAKRPRITINTYGDVELVWPHGMAKRHIKPMLQTHTAWVLKQLAQLDIQDKPSLSLPQSMDLQAIAQSWVVAYQHAESAVRIQEQGTTLTIVGNRKDKERIRQALLTWIKKKGRQHLKPWLAEVAEEMQLSYQSVSIRLQKRRWGSCSAKKRLNLNAGLLFLPDFLVRHVLIHELTHIKHLNHSASFWRDVEKYDKHYKENRKLLKEYAKDVPAWLSQAFDEPLA